MSRTDSRLGFGLIEVLIAAAIAAVALAAATRAVGLAAGLASTSLARGRIDESASSALLVLVRELRWARPDGLLVTSENGASRLDYQVAEGFDGDATVWSEPVVVRYEPAPDDGNGNGAADEGFLVWMQGGRQRVLCRDVALGGFVVAMDGARVDLELAVFAVDQRGDVLSGNAACSVALANREEGP